MCGIITAFLAIHISIASNAQQTTPDTAKRQQLLKTMMAKLDVTGQKSAAIQKRLLQNQDYFLKRVRQPLTPQQMDAEIHLNQMRIDEILLALTPEERKRFDESIEIEKKAQTNRLLKSNQDAFKKVKKRTN